MIRIRLAWSEMFDNILAALILFSAVYLIANFFTGKF